MVSLALGTVQFGLDYGVANTDGKASEHSAKAIIEVALRAGVRWLDTAKLYGNSEEVVGKCLGEIEHSLSQKAQVVTKIPSIKTSTQKEMDLWLEQSLASLKRSSVEGLMLHDASDITEANESLLDHFFNYKKMEEVGRVGVSVYTVKQAEIALEYENLGILQVPSNIFDRSFVDAEIFKRCKERGITVFVRSIFLQGLFFMGSDNAKVKQINGASKALSILHQFCAEYECSVLELCFADARRFEDAYILTGVDNVTQLELNIDSMQNAEQRVNLLNEWDTRRPQVKEELINPSLWDLKM